LRSVIGESTIGTADDDATARDDRILGESEHR
jgi:hypothetical protein